MGIRFCALGGDDLLFVSYFQPMQRLLFLIIFVILCSCKQKRTESYNLTLQPKVVPAHGYIVPKNSMAEPKVILVDEGKLKKVPVGKPKVVMGCRI
jgi:hypothetical protein